MILLALDTSGACVTAAVHRQGHVLAEASVRDPRRHAELTAPMVEDVLAAAGVDRRRLTAVAVGVGPGPFTGLRVGIVTARVLGAALGVHVPGLCSLDALAAATPGEGDLVVATDARRREVYWARYRRGPWGAERVEGPHVGSAEDVPVRDTDVTGRGCLLYPDELGPSAGPLDVEAGALAHVVAGRLAAGGHGLLPPVPLYLRRPDAQEPGARKRVLS